MNNYIELFTRFWFHLSKNHQKNFVSLIFLMLFVAIAEMFTIASVVPFLGVIAAPEKVFNLDIFQGLISYLELTSPNQIILPITIIFVIAAIFSGLMRGILLWSNIKFSFSSGSDLSVKMYERTIYQPYSVHLNRNSSQVISGVTIKTNILIHIIGQVLVLLTNIFIVTAILIILLYLNPLVAIIVFSFFGFFYFFIFKFTQKKLSNNSNLISSKLTLIIKNLNEGLGCIRDIVLTGKQPYYVDLYKKADFSLRKAQGSIQFISLSPRYVMDAVGIVVIAIIAYFMTLQNTGILASIPFLGALGLGAQKILPLMQQSWSAISTIRGNHGSLEDTFNLIEQSAPVNFEKKNIRSLPFTKEILLKNISFRYSSKLPFVIKNFSLSIKKGSRIGFIGKTGSGKSTIMDIVMGLLDPTKGLFLVDGEIVSKKNMRNWQRIISHVPQVIFLSDRSIEENIAFGIPTDEIDHNRIKKAAKMAQIDELIESLPKKYKSLIGERGVRLSGGQRQRIGIARALYNNAEVIIFDEATSSLDTETEKVVMESINSLSKNLTILIIAHRITTLKNCDAIISLENGNIVNIGSYNEIN
jgi:ABC-type multidrug transport system fused ATPase/permease subunit